MGGGGGFFRDYSPEEFKKEINESLKNTENVAFEGEVEFKISELLSEYNDRDDESIQDHLYEVKEIIEKEVGNSIDLKFGGSVSKHTYVDGLSDVDILVTIDNTHLSNSSPQEVLNYLRSKLKTRLTNLKSIKVGNLAVTMTFSDNIEIQMLPAVKHYSGFKIPSSNGKNWSDIIHPKKFAERLTEINKNLNNNVVPTIKLVKGIIAQFPKDHQLKGYHIESIAIEAFKRYPNSKPKTTKTLLKHFFEKAKDIVKSPIKDKTGQSINVDSYLGPKNSVKRSIISYILNRVYNKMENADRIRSVPEWSKILEGQ